MGLVRAQDTQGVDLIKDGQVYKYDAGQDRFVPVDLPALFTTVVDIGPHSNNGPGDQTKGIRNWNASPIKLVVAPGLLKFNHVVVWGLQYKPGAAAYVDPDAPNGQFPSIQFGLTLPAILFGAQNGIADWGLDALDPKVWPSLPVAGANFSVFGGLYGINQSAQAKVENQAIYFGGVGSNELTTGDGTVRITVHYTIDDILT